MLNNPITEAWSRLRYFLKSFGAIFGEPAQIAAHLFISAAHRAGILSWLRPLERAARLIVLAEAEAMDVQAAPARKREHRGTRSSRKGWDVSLENSEAWRVSFRMVDPERATRSARKPHLDPGVRPYDPKPLAARFEALIRVALAPARYARRLALRLSRRALSYLQRERLFTCKKLPKNPIERVIPEIPCLVCVRRRHELRTLHSNR